MLKARHVKMSVHADIPVIDISAFAGGTPMTRLSIGRHIVEACEDWGFFFLKGHGISQGEIDNWFKAARQFFDKPQAFKDRYSIAHSDRFQGYEPPKSSESKEAYVLGPERDADDPLVEKSVKYHGSNTWPDIDGWRETAIGQMDTMLTLAKRINRGLALGLGVRENAFDRLSIDPMYALRYLHYTPSNITGINTHTDWGMLSLVIQDQTPGLEIQGFDGKWLRVPVMKDAILVNVGEMVEIFSGGQITATPHRVVNRGEKDRYSMAFFLDMDHDAVLRPVTETGKMRYKPITVSEFIDKMHMRDYKGEQK